MSPFHHLTTAVRRLSIVLALLPQAFSLPAAVAADKLALTEETSIRFATAAEGATILSADDEFSRRLSPFDLQVRLRTTDSASTEAWRAFVAKQPLEWEPADVEMLTTIVEGLREKLKPLRLPLPAEVLLVHTTGKEESGAPHTRTNAIVLPTNSLRQQASQLEALLLHELFHVLSRHDRNVRRELYRAIGFELVPEIELPPSLAKRKITNPDAPAVDCIMQLTVDGKKLTAAPLIYATPESFAPKHGSSLFDYLTFRMLVVEEHDDKLQAVMKDGRPMVLDPKRLDSFYEQIGRNTQYIIHPDEILADNFMYLVQKRKNLPTPRVIDRMAKVLAK